MRRFGEGLTRILVNYSAVRGELYAVERHELGRASAKYFLRCCRDFKLAIIGHPPVIDGFVALVAVNRGLTSAIFYETKKAVQWLRLFDAPQLPKVPKTSIVSIGADFSSPTTWPSAATECCASTRCRISGSGRTGA